MSHYLYRITLPDGKAKSGQITAKTEVKALERLKELYEYLGVQSIREKTTQAKTIAKPAPPVKLVPVAKVVPAIGGPVASKAKSKLEKLLFLQSNQCFFCGRVLTKVEASIEHLQPKSGGGNNADGNVVACCRTLNQTFGNISLKRKFEIVLEKAGNFTCPS